jgi:hypothetical protein
MATKWVKLPVTLHGRDDKASVPFKFDVSGAVLQGKHVPLITPAGTPVELDADEADRLLKLFPEGEEVAAPGKSAAKAEPSKTDA